MWPLVTASLGLGLVGDISRSLGPGLVIDTEARDVSSTGIFDNPELQAQVVARAQAAELLLAATNGSNVLGSHQRQALVRRAISTTEDVAAAPYRVLRAEEHPPLLAHEPETVGLLDVEWREIDES